MSYTTTRLTECLDRQFRTAQQTCRPNSGVQFKNWKRPTASSTRRGSLFEVDIDDRDQEEEEVNIIAIDQLLGSDNISLLNKETHWIHTLGTTG
ncbi:hypothetical protein ElyMa_005491400 [Elysia marginata]|uniref:Uncharacterized protein n=1 Tax=Elysia marginata TaxID=1093978 RepID=A0AAV4ETD4_9GAST|nr:hypothetical protein ElyMa_005491400 [Elysia marginata]